MKKYLSYLAQALEFILITLPFKYLSYPFVIFAITFLLLSHYKRNDFVFLHQYLKAVVNYTHTFFFSVTQFIEIYVPVLDLSLSRHSSDILWIAILFLSPIMTRCFISATKLDKVIAIVWGAIGFTYATRFAVDDSRSWISNLDYPLYLAAWAVFLVIYFLSNETPKGKSDAWKVLGVIGGVIFIFIWLYFTEFMEIL